MLVVFTCGSMASVKGAKNYIIYKRDSAKEEG